MIGLAALLLVSGLAVGAPAKNVGVVIDAALTGAAPCSTPAPPALAAALREGLPLRWVAANRLFPDAHLERALVRRVIVRAASVGVCGGRVVAQDVSVRLVGPRGRPMEVVLATTLAPGILLGVTEDDVAVRPPPGSVRVTARDTFTAYGAWTLGGVRGFPRSSSMGSAGMGGSGGGAGSSSSST